jgi:hypothetical protein
MDNTLTDTGGELAAMLETSSLNTTLQAEQQPFPFFDLPLQLRKGIYRLLTMPKATILGVAKNYSLLGFQFLRLLTSAYQSLVL